MRARFTLLFLLFFAGLTALVLAAEPDAATIIKKMTEANQSQAAVSKAKMILIDKSGGQRVRDLLTRTKLINGVRNTVTTFLSPPDVKGVKFLVVETKNTDDNQRLYLPAMKRVRRITSANKSGSFMGSTFSYADLQAVDPDKGTHKRLADATVDGASCYVIESIPKKDGDSIYGRMINWVRKDNYFPIRGQFFDKKGVLWKTLEVGQLEQRADGTWMARRSKMSDVQAGTATIMELGEYQLNVKLDDQFFTERFLSDESQQ